MSGIDNAGTGQQTASQAGKTVSAAPEKSGDWVESLAQRQEPAASKADAAEPSPDAAKPAAGGEAGEREAGDPLDAILPEKQGEATDAEDDGEAEKDKAEEDKPLELAFPEGFVKDDAMLDEFQAIAKEAGMKKEAAQKIADLYVAGQKKMADAFANEHKRIIDRINKDWIAENHADPDFGGDKFEESNNYLTKAIRHFVPADELHTKDGRLGFLELIEQANMRNCPQLRRFFVRVGQYLSESGPMASDASEASKPKRDADVIFG